MTDAQKSELERLRKIWDDAVKELNSLTWQRSQWDNINNIPPYNSLQPLSVREIIRQQAFASLDPKIATQKNKVEDAKTEYEVYLAMVRAQEAQLLEEQGAQQQQNAQSTALINESEAKKSFAEFWNKNGLVVSIVGAVVIVSIIIGVVIVKIRRKKSS